MRYEEEEKLLKSLASASFRISNIFSTGIALSPHDWLILCWSVLYSCLCPSAAHISAQWGHLSLWQSLSDSVIQATLESFVSHHQPTAAVSIFTPSLEMMPAMSCIVGPCPFPSQYPLYLSSSINLNSSLLIWKPLPSYHAAVLPPSILWFSALLFLLGHWSRIVVSEAC